MVNEGDVIILTGPPGSGKTTAAGTLAAEFERGVHLEADDFFRAIKSGFVPPHLEAAHTQNTTVIDVVADAAAGYATAGYTVVWDGIVGPWFLDRVVARLAERDVRLHYLVLRATIEESLARVRARDGTTEVSGAEVMWRQFADLGPFERHVVSGDGDLATVAARCMDGVLGGHHRLAADPPGDRRWSVSVKGVLAWNDRGVVLRNERDEWELPGGRLDATDESPAAALRREFVEELGIEVAVEGPVDSWIYDVEGSRVLILTYEVSAARPPALSHSPEHVGVGEFDLRRLRSESIPAGYLRSIERALGQSQIAAMQKSSGASDPSQ